MVALPELLSLLRFTSGAPTTVFQVAIPLDPALGGLQVMTQAASDDALANAFGWRASNGGRCMIGL